MWKMGVVTDIRVKWMRWCTPVYRGKEDQKLKTTFGCVLSSRPASGK